MILLTLIIVLLFLGDFLTGREHLVFQDPYSRLTRVIERKYAMASRDETLSNAMSDYYYNELKQKPEPHNWQTAPDSYSIARFTGRRVPDKAPIASVLDLDVNQEVFFLRAMPTNKVRIAVIHSLFHERGEGTEPTAQSRRTQWDDVEKLRMGLIAWWAQYGSKDPSISPARWWHQNASFFGLTPDGDPLTTPKAVMK